MCEMAMSMQGYMDEGRGGVTIEIAGMTCGGCVNAVTRALSRVPGVAGAEVDLAGGRAVIAGSARPEDLVAAVAAAGFRARLLGR